MFTKKFILSFIIFVTITIPAFTHTMLKDIVLEDAQCKEIYEANDFKMFIEEMANPPQSCSRDYPDDFIQNPIMQYLINCYPAAIVFKNHNHFQTIDAQSRDGNSLIPTALATYRVVKKQWVASLDPYYLNVLPPLLQTTRTMLCRVTKRDKKLLARNFNDGVTAGISTAEQEAYFMEQEAYLFYFAKRYKILCTSIKKLKKQEDLGFSDIFIDER